MMLLKSKNAAIAVSLTRTNTDFTMAAYRCGVGAIIRGRRRRVRHESPDEEFEIEGWMVGQEEG